tara:strand:- start:1947 stop:2216 length:270 start_codon:yes stop_codon:yes gene_type:complete
MKRLDSLKKIVKCYTKNKILTIEDSKLIIKMQAALKEHVLQGICTYCAKDVDIKGLTLSQTHDYHTNGMCLNCLDELKKEPNKDLKWLN